MKKIIRLSALLGLTMLVGCTTPGKVEMPVVTSYENSQLEQKKVAYQISYQAPEHGVFYDGEMLPPRDISEARLSFQSRKVFNEFNRILTSQLPSNALITNKQTPDFTLKAEFVANDSDGPVYVDDQTAETILKDALTLGLAGNEQKILADFQVTYTILGGDGIELFSQKYKVNDAVDHEKSDYEYSNETGKTLGGQLLEKHITLTLNEFMKELASKS